MKKLFILLSVCLLSACSNPDVVRPFGYDSPTYYKVPECYTVIDYPESYKSWDPVAGRYDTYVTFDKTTHTECNYNPLINNVQPQPSLNSFYLYGHSED